MDRRDYPDIAAAAKDVLRERPGMTAASINEEFKARGWGDILALDILEGLLAADPDVSSERIWFVSEE